MQPDSQPVRVARSCALSLHCGVRGRERPKMSENQAEGNTLRKANKHHTSYYNMGYQQNFSIKLHFE